MKPAEYWKKYFKRRRLTEDEVEIIEKARLRSGCPQVVYDADFTKARICVTLDDPPPKWRRSNPHKTYVPVFTSVFIDFKVGERSFGAIGCSKRRYDDPFDAEIGVHNAITRAVRTSVISLK